MLNFKEFLNKIEILKQNQLNIIKQSNPMIDNIHTGIRTINDIKTANEVFEQDDTTTPDFTKIDMQNALRKGSIIMYSSKPFTMGIFITPSKMEAQNYAGNKKIYSKEIPLNHIAWIDAIEGQYTPINFN